MTRQKNGGDSQLSGYNAPAEKVPSPKGSIKVVDQQTQDKDKRSDIEKQSTLTTSTIMEDFCTFQSKIRVSNSIISPHTYKFSTHIGRTSTMKWDQVARIPLQNINQETFIETLDGKRAQVPDQPVFIMDNLYRQPHSHDRHSLKSSARDNHYSESDERQKKGESYLTLN